MDRQSLKKNTRFITKLKNNGYLKEG